MRKEIIKDIEWKVRSYFISPLVESAQRNFWNIVRRFLDNAPNGDIEELKSFFSWKKIAIVWNSPILEKSGFWEEIDSHDIVIRFNRGILEKSLDSKNTGRKIDFWVVWALDTLMSFAIKKQVKSVKEKVSILAPMPYSQTAIKALDFNIWILELTPPYDIMEKKYMELELYEYGYSLIWAVPSSWFLMIAYLLNHTSPQEIALYWFSFSSNNRISWETYSSQHNFSKEEEIIKWWMKKDKRLKLFQ